MGPSDPLSSPLVLDHTGRFQRVRNWDDAPFREGSVRDRGGRRDRSNGGERGKVRHEVGGPLESQGSSRGLEIRGRRGSGARLRGKDGKEDKPQWRVLGRVRSGEGPA